MIKIDGLNKYLIVAASIISPTTYAVDYDFPPTTVPFTFTDDSSDTATILSGNTITTPTSATDAFSIQTPNGFTTPTTTTVESNATLSYSGTNTSAATLFYDLNVVGIINNTINKYDTASRTRRNSVVLL